MAWWWSGSSRREANAPLGTKSASIMRSMPVRVIGCTVFERYQKRCVRKATGSTMGSVHGCVGVMVASVAIAVSWAIRVADIMLGQKMRVVRDHLYRYQRGQALHSGQLVLVFSHAVRAAFWKMWPQRVRVAVCFWIGSIVIGQIFLVVSAWSRTASMMWGG